MDNTQKDKMSATSSLKIDREVKSLEIDFSIPRIIEIIPRNSNGKNPRYYLKITKKGGATLV